MITLVEVSQIAPPRLVLEQSLPLTILDIIWLTYHPIRRLVFYKFPCSKPYFLETVIPKLKQSLSLTLNHLFPLAGNIIYPLNPVEVPVIRYIPGNSVSMTICESSDDFDSFVANHPQDADKFYDLVPQFQPWVEHDNHKLIKVLALQVTLFPNHGICIGIAFHHCIGDGSSIAAFLRLWASINQFGEEGDILSTRSESLPIFDRSVFKYPKIMDMFYLKLLREFPFQSVSFPLPTERFRATYVLSQSQLEKLKRLIHINVPSIEYVSSFVAMAGYIWSCLAKSDGREEDDRPEYFLIAIDLRARLDPPVPGNYFGNCISYGLAKVSYRELIRDKGMFVAAEAVAKEIRERVSDKKILEDSMMLTAASAAAKQGSMIAAAGSTKVDIYGADFGWGKARKLEVLANDDEKYCMVVGKSREGGLEIGLSLPKLRMYAFEACFANGLKNI